MKNNDQVGSRQGSQYWLGHVVSWRQSGLGQAEYCRQHGLGVKKFGWAREIRPFIDMTWLNTYEE
ncbi:MAG: hypothetical protein N2A40_05015 [Desulfobulbaceae bacterium]